MPLLVLAASPLSGRRGKDKPAHLHVNVESLRKLQEDLAIALRTGQPRLSLRAISYQPRPRRPAHATRPRRRAARRPAPRRPSRPGRARPRTAASRAAAARHPARRRRAPATTSRSEMNETSATTRSNGSPMHRRLEAARVGALEHDDARIARGAWHRAGRSRRRRRRRARAVLEQAIGEAPGRGADVEADPARRVDAEIGRVHRRACRRRATRSAVARRAAARSHRAHARARPCRPARRRRAPGPRGSAPARGSATRRGLECDDAFVEAPSFTGRVFAAERAHGATRCPRRRARAPRGSRRDRRAR